MGKRLFDRLRVLAVVLLILLVISPLLYMTKVVQKSPRSTFSAGDQWRLVECPKEGESSPSNDPAEAVFGPIDVVFTYVNGSTPQFMHDYRMYGAKNSMGRFRDYDTLKYALRSVEKFLPWAGNVYIYTNGELPGWLNLDCPRLRTVTHQETFEDPADLPTFSSHPIESHLHRLPGLRERFVYCNDDMMFGSEMGIDQFWTDVDKTVLFLSKAKIPGPHEVPRNIWRRALQSSNKVLNADPDIPEVNSRFYPLHHCYNFRRSVLQEMSYRFRDAYIETRHKRFRHPDDITIPFLYANYLPYTDIPYYQKSKTDFIYVTATNDISQMRGRYHSIVRRQPKFLCFNDAFHGDPTDEALDYLHGWFEKYFPEKSCFEKQKIS